MNKVFDSHVNATIARLCGSKPSEVPVPTFKRGVLIAKRSSLNSLLQALGNRDALVSEARNNGLSSVRAKYNLHATFIEDLLELAMLEYDAHNFLLACELLKAFRLLASVDSITVSFEKQLSALWGSLSCNFLLEQWDTACELLLSLKDALDSLMIGRYRKSIGYHMSVLVNWIPILVFLAPTMNQKLVHLLISEHCISVILTTESHLIPFVAAAVIAAQDLDSARGRAIVSDLADVNDPFVKVAHALLFTASPELLATEIGRAKSTSGMLSRFAKNDIDKLAFSKLFEIMEKTQISIASNHMEKYFAGMKPGNSNLVKGWCQAAGEAVVESLM